MASLYLTYIEEKMRVKRYAKRTIESYVYWIKAYINFNDKKHPNDCHNEEVEAFLTYLANVRTVTPKTQAVALNVLVFLYRDIIEKPLTLALNFNRTFVQPILPTMLTTTEIRSLLQALASEKSLIVELLYGSGLRLMEAVRLRVQDIDFDYF